MLVLRATQIISQRIKADRKTRPAFAFGGADEETRTLDPRITSAVLYQLSYIGLARIAQLQSLTELHALVGTSLAGVTEPTFATS